MSCSAETPLRALLLALLLAWLAGPRAMPGAPQSPAPAAKTWKENARRARVAFDLGRRAELAGEWRAAHEHYTEAAQLDPQPEYWQAREAARFRRAQQHVDRAEGAAVTGDFAQALIELRAALLVDPGYEIARERLAQMEARAAQEARLAAFAQQGPLLPKLQARQPGRRSVNFRGNTRGAYEEIGRLFGVTATFDDQLRVRPLQFRAPDVDLDMALNLLATQSSTFWFAVDERAFFVADNTVQKVREFAPVIARTIALPTSATNERMTELLRVLREIGGLTRLQLDLRNRSITVRDTPENVALAAALIAEFEQPRGELMLEVSLLELDRRQAQRLGIRPPVSAQVFTLSPQDLDRIQNPSSPGELAELLQRIFGAAGAGGVGGLVPPLVAFGGGRTIALATLPGAAADFAQTLNVLRRARRLLLRASDGEPASFFIGERFPINFAVLTAGANSFTGVPATREDIVPRRDFPAGDAPSAIITFDFNADQFGDLAVANAADNTVSILLGNGDGTFTAANDFPTGAGPAALAAGDFNADGVLDLVTADQGANTVSVLFGNGDGTFDPPVAFGTGASPRAVVVGNLNGDARLDLVVANGNDNTVSVLLGNTTTTFGPRTDFSVGVSPAALAVDDFDDDNFLDVVAANQADDTVSVLIGAGNGTFTLAGHFAVGNGPRAVATNDMNRDRITDIVTANEIGDTVSILLGNGDGTFSPATRFTAGDGPAALFLADFDGSGTLDLLVANRNADTFSLIFGNGDGTLGLRADFATGDGPVAVAVANFNGDGRLDAAFANEAADSITVILNSSTVITPGGFVPQQPYPGVQYEDLGLKVRATPRMHLNGEVTLQMAFELRTRSGETLNGIPVISNRTLEQMVRTRANETTVLAGMLQREGRLGLEGWPGLAYAPVTSRAASKRDKEQVETELLIFITPRQIRLAPRADRALYTGRETPGALTGRAAGPP